MFGRKSKKEQEQPTPPEGNNNGNGVKLILYKVDEGYFVPVGEKRWDEDGFLIEWNTGGYIITKEAAEKAFPGFHSELISTNLLAQAYYARIKKRINPETT